MCASVSRPGSADIHPASVCAFRSNRSVSAGRASTAQTFRNPRSAPGCLFGRFSAEAPCSPHLFDPALAFWLNSGQVRQKDIQQMVCTVINTAICTNFLSCFPAFPLPFCPTVDVDIAAGCLSSL